MSGGSATSTPGTAPASSLGLQDRYGAKTNKFFVNIGQAPSTSWLNTNARLLGEQWDLDGTWIEPYYTDPFWGATTNASWRTGSGYAIPWNLFSTCLTDLQTAGFSKLSQNFIRVNLITQSAASGGISHFGDWFDEAFLKTVYWNVRMMARLACQTGCKGIILDCENYPNATNYAWKFDNQKGAQNFAAYQAQVYQFAKNLMWEIQGEFPDIVLGLAIGYEQLDGIALANLHSNLYGLYPKFLDGLHDAATGGTVIVNCCEATYYWTVGSDAATVAYYKDWQVNTTNASALGMYCGSSNYLKAHETGMSIWLDVMSDGSQSGFVYTSPWTGSPSNFWTPTTFETGLETRLAATDRYVFIYTSQCKFFNYATS